MIRTDPEEFRRFHELLTWSRPDYIPFYFPLVMRDKDPIPDKGWKGDKYRITAEQAITFLEHGYNIGIAGTDHDNLVIIDIDDISVTPLDTMKPTLMSFSRKRIGRHHFYFSDDPRCRKNLPTNEAGEIRTDWQYTVAPGSYVPCSEKEIEQMPPEQRELAGRYTVEAAISPTDITHDALPQVFKDQIEKEKKAATTPKKRAKHHEKKNGSALFSLSLHDVIGATPNKERFPSLFHGSGTGKNTSVSGGLLHCWRHNVSQTPLSALAVMAGIATCQEAGVGHRGSGVGPSTIDYEDGRTLFRLWKFAKQEGMIPANDPIPSKALSWYAVDQGICKPDDAVDGWKLPADAYNQAITLIEAEEKISSGRQRTKLNTAAEEMGFTISPDAFLVGKEKVFDANKFAKWLIDSSGFIFVTLKDTSEVLWYDVGVYLNGGDVEIGKIIEQVMDGFKVTTHSVNEVIGHIRRRTYVERDEFDNDKRIINLKNGLYDTRTGEIKPHTPEYLSTVQIPITYDPAATCPGIDKFLSEVLDARDIETGIEWFGYVLEPEYWIQKMLMLLGEGENGKSKFLGLLEAFIGKKNCVNESIHQLVNNRFRVANLYGKLANIHADISDKELKETGILKLLSGGDRISGRKKNMPPFEFENYARLIFSANRLPRAHDDTDAWYRRWTFINFTRKFGNDPDAVKTADKKLLDKLIIDTELSGLLNRALEALRGLHDRGGFSRNMSTEETRKIYTRLSDPVAVFIEDWCMMDPKATVKRSMLFNAYVEFCKVNHQASIGQAAFTKRIKDIGRFSECQVGGGEDRERGWRGITIERGLLSHDTLSDTLDKSQTSLSSEGNDTDDTLQKPFAGKFKENDSVYVKLGGEAKKSVSSVSSVETDSDLGVLPSVSLSVSSDRKLLEKIKSGIFQITYSAIDKKFTSSDLLSKYFGILSTKIPGLTTEILTEILNSHLHELKIIKLDDKTYKQEE